jgi:cytochrome c oxidase subunit 4
VFSWLGLLALLALTVVLAYQPLGVLNTPAAMLIAWCKALLITAVFMELRGGTTLARVFACAGVLWLAVMFWLSFADYATRPNFPSAGGPFS